MTVPLVLSISVEQVTFCISPLGTFWKFSTSAITSRFPLRSAKEGEGEWTQSVHLFCFHIYILILALCYCFFQFFCHGKCKFFNWVIIFSTRQYTVPDPPGLFDGHVWPMYLKHRREMEDSGLYIGMLQLGCFIQFVLCRCMFVRSGSKFIVCSHFHSDNYLLSSCFYTSDQLINLFTCCRVPGWFEIQRGDLQPGLWGRSEQSAQSFIGETERKQI